VRTPATLVADGFCLAIPFCRFRLVLFFTGAAAGQNKPERLKGDETEPGGRVAGVSESAVRAKRGWVRFGAKPARSETPVRAAAERRPPRRGRSGKEEVRMTEGCGWMVVRSLLGYVHVTLAASA
jgi:hypothetical protein